VSADLVTVGSVALDTIETPFGRREEILGGAASHFSLAASVFTPVRLVGVVGEDFPAAQLQPLQGRAIDLSGLQAVAGTSFRWEGRYHLDMNQRDTLKLDLGVFATFRPHLPAEFTSSEVLFLANIDPDLQLQVLDQFGAARLTGCDTIDHWIREKRDRIDELFSRVDLVFLNEDEARLYAGTSNLHRAARAILDRGCRAVLLKKGENGAIVLRRRDGADALEVFAVAAYPLEEVVDPTGAGDAFAGGVMGTLARNADFGLERLREAAVVGSVVASFNVEGFGVERMLDVRLEDVEGRYDAMRRMVMFEPAPAAG